MLVNTIRAVACTICASDSANFGLVNKQFGSDSFISSIMSESEKYEVLEKIGLYS